MKITTTENEEKVLKVLAEAYDSSGWDETGFYTFAPLESITGLDRRAVRLACRSLTRKGLAKFLRGLWNDDGPAGAGYGATRQGAALISPCDVCGDLCDYEYDGKRECEKHYKQSTTQSVLLSPHN